ncbi:MAG TPA: hypothetical protein VGJ60_07485 [Chloroflexota bacterium]
MTDAPTCRDCAIPIDPTGASVPTLCPECYAKHRARIQTELLALIERGTSLDQLLDELRWQLLELGMHRETADRSVDRMRVSMLLNLPWEAVATS